jgi:hypothetical protein
MPDGKHFRSDIAAVLSFAKWYARAYLDRDSGGWRPTREQIALKILNPDYPLTVETARRNESWKECLRKADAILALTPPPPQEAPHG